MKKNVIKYKNFFKTALFIVLVISMLSGFLSVFNYKSTGGGGGWKRFYEAEEDSIDVLFFGSSHAHCTVDHGLLWDDYGIAGYTLSAGSQNLDSTYYFVKEALKTQKPRVILVEVLGATEGKIINTQEDVYRNSLGMKWSANFTEYISYLSESMGMDNTQAMEVYMKFPIIHSRYRELTQSDFEDSVPFMRGYRGSFEKESFDRPLAADNQGVLDLDPQKLAILQNIIDTARENEVPVVFFASPFILSDEHQMQFNTIETFAKQNDVPFINYNKLYDEIGIDFENDFRDGSHVNNYGAVKVTSHLAEFLKSNYDLPDRRNEKGYELWNQNALFLRNKIYRHELEEAEDINEYLQILSESEDEQLVLIALSGNYNALGEIYLEKLMQLGIEKEEYYAGGIFTIKGGEVVAHETEDEGKLLFKGQNYQIVENGINIIVYNETIDQLIDIAGDDVYLGLDMVRGEKIEDE